MTLAKLRAIADALLVMKPSWKLEELSVKEARKDGTFDPPCAFLRRVNGTFNFQLCSDGEFYLGGKDPVMLDPQKTPKEIARELVRIFNDAV